MNICMHREREACICMCVEPTSLFTESCFCLLVDHSFCKTNCNIRFIDIPQNQVVVP